MNTQWFDNAELRKLCVDNNMEAMISGEDVVVFVCPKLPPVDVLGKIKGHIPPEFKVKITEGPSMAVVATIRTILLMAGIVRVNFDIKPNHHVDLLIQNGMKMEGTEPDSPLWDKMADLLMVDQFSNTFKIIIDGMVVRSGSRDGLSVEGVPSQPSSPQNVPAVSVKDNRFNYDRAYLPKDVGTDVRILLETTESVEEFLARI